MVKENDEALQPILMGISLFLIGKEDIKNESETTSSQLGRKSTESGSIYMDESESVPRRSTILRNRW
jgi:hypothetical protein